MDAIHRIIGFVVVSSFGLTALWGLAYLIIRRDPGRMFWHLIAISQVLIFLQVIVGLILWILPNTILPETLHLLYGLFSAGAMFVAQIDARHRDRKPWVPFVWAELFAFGLTFRALQTGMGW